MATEVIRIPGPVFLLPDVRKAAADDVAFEDRADEEELGRLLDSAAEKRQFARRVVAQLAADDYCHSTQRGNSKADVYAVVVSPATLKEFGFEGKNTWYAKLQIQSFGYGEAVMFISLHRLKLPALDRRGGALYPDWKD